MSQNDEGADLSKIQEELEAQGKMIRRIDRRMRYATYGSIVRWLVYVGIALGTFVWLQPYLEALVGAAQKIQGGAGAVSDFKQGFTDSWRDAYREFITSFTGSTTTSAR